MAALAKLGRFSHQHVIVAAPVDLVTVQAVEGLETATGMAVHTRNVVRARRDRERVIERGLIPRRIGVAVAVVARGREP